MTQTDNIVKFYNDWFSNPKWWFSATKDDDTYIKNEYAGLLSGEYKVNHFHTLHPNQQLAWILIHDQLPRHIYRYDSCAHIYIKQFLEHAIEFTNILCNSDLLNTFRTCEICFILLPYRHSNNIDLVLKAIKIGWSLLLKNPNDTYIKRFIKASYARAPKDQTPFAHTQVPTCSPMRISNFQHVLDSRCNSYITAQPLKLHASRPSKIHASVKHALEVLLYDSPDIIISLSGGVDSIVLSFILCELYPKHLIKAVHIDYANRESSAEEAALVGAWCNHLGIKCAFRRIDEINRKDCMENGLRSTYESYTRVVRFNTYKVMSSNPIVFLGHNLNDSFENILTNVAKRTKYENLTGWDVLSHQDGIKFVRPMLDIDKSDIYTFATKHMLPFVYDSTVKWSQRGKIRDVIVPTLNHWDKQAIPAFFQLARNTSYMYTTVQVLVDSFIDKTSGTTLNMNMTSLIIKNELFWRQYINKLMSVHISNASLTSFVGRLSLLCENPKRRPFIKVILSKWLFVQVKIHNDITCTLTFTRT